MDPLDILEDRISIIEKRVYGNEVHLTSIPNQSVIDIALHVNSLLTSALNGRDSIINAFKYMSKLNDFLDPNYLDTSIDIEIKKQFIIVMEPKIRQTIVALKKMNELLKVLDSQTINNITDLFPKLDKFSMKYLGLKEQNDEFIKTFENLLGKYNQINNSVNATIVQTDANLKQIEAKQNVKAVDD